jgi:hypothetical protein
MDNKQFIDYTDVLIQQLANTEAFLKEMLQTKAELMKLIKEKDSLLVRSSMYLQKTEKCLALIDQFGILLQEDDKGQLKIIIKKGSTAEKQLIKVVVDNPEPIVKKCKEDNEIDPCGSDLHNPNICSLCGNEVHGCTCMEEEF